MFFSFLSISKHGGKCQVLVSFSQNKFIMGNVKVIRYYGSGCKPHFEHVVSSVENGMIDFWICNSVIFSCFLFNKQLISESFVWNVTL